MKIRFPAGIPLDDLEPGQNYRLTLRNKAKPIFCELLELKLKRYLQPRLAILPRGKPYMIEIAIGKIEEIALAELDLSNADYSKDE